ncbi:MAG: thioredoxin domain-containing protein [Gemmatimonadetes bacterium]|nr:thioredoxin domain-containing protein [Gemmatimonadota bacterium]NIR81575.1 thioredoxin domain-containing protein [Gemmatimonadota bacterium]NIT90416.1 thioredoxin domain-containing protein [Gemmatimonadota bacterium]NIU34250.1 thioredoxin domain-containing protein [Gemmatimonadota bacterium]NIU38378.1 thioredoxin domain-containing protein [Gemmatimonadota bacterium]
MTPPDLTPSRRFALPALVLALSFCLSTCGEIDPRGEASPGKRASEATGTADASRLFGQMPSPGDGGADGGTAGARGGVGQSAPDTTPPPDAGGSGSRTVDVRMLGFNRGDPEAPIRVIEFSDFGCGYCRKFHLETFPTLEEEFIETGKVIWKYVPFVLGMFPNSVEAATAGECAGEQGRFAALRDRLFQDQPEWRKADEPHGLFARYADEEGLDVERFRACVEEGWVTDRVRRSVRAGHRIGVRGTPTFIVEGFPLQGALPTPVFREVFGRLLEEEGGAGTPP